MAKQLRKVHLADLELGAVSGLIYTVRSQGRATEALMTDVILATVYYRKLISLDELAYVLSRDERQIDEVYIRKMRGEGLIEGTSNAYTLTKRGRQRAGDVIGHVLAISNITTLIPIS